MLLEVGCDGAFILKRIFNHLITQISLSLKCSLMIFFYLMCSEILKVNKPRQVFALLQLRNRFQIKLILKSVLHSFFFCWFWSDLPSTCYPITLAKDLSVVIAVYMCLNGKADFKMRYLSMV